MRYYQLFFYTEGQDYDVKEVLIDEGQMRAIQKAYAEGKKFIVMKDRMIRMESIKEINPADNIVDEYLKMGVPLKQIGLSDVPQLGMGNRPELDEEGLKKLTGMKEKSGFGKMIER